MHLYRELKLIEYNNTFGLAPLEKIFWLHHWPYENCWRERKSEGCPYLARCIISKKRRLSTRIGSYVPMPKRMGESSASVHWLGAPICSRSETKCSAIWLVHLFSYCWTKNLEFKPYLCQNSIGILTWWESNHHKVETLSILTKITLF